MITARPPVQVTTVKSPGRSIPIAVGLGVGTWVATLLLLAVTAGPSDPITLGLFAAVFAIGGFTLFHYSVELFVLALIVARGSLDRFGGVGPVTPASLTAMVMIGTTVLWVLLRPREKRHPQSFLQNSMLMYAAAAGLSVFVSFRPSVSALEFLRLVSAICVFLLIERLIAAGASERRLLAAILASAIIPLAVAAVNIASPGTLEQKGEFDRLAATFSQSNGFSRYLMVLLIMALASLPMWSKRITKLIILGGCAFGTIALVLTYTRASWLGAAGGIGLVIFSQKRLRLPGTLTAVLILLLLAPTLGARFADLAGSEQGDAAINSANSLEWRFEYWADVIALASDSPVNGIGLGTTAKVTVEEKQPHSEVIRAYAEMGIVGLITYGLFMTALMRTAIDAVRRTTGEARLFAVGFFAVAASFVAVSLVTNAMDQTALLWYLFALSAIALSLTRRGADQLSVAPPLATRLRARWGTTESRVHRTYV